MFVRRRLKYQHRRLGVFWVQADTDTRFKYLPGKPFRAKIKEPKREYYLKIGYIMSWLLAVMTKSTSKNNSGCNTRSCCKALPISYQISYVYLNHIHTFQHVQEEWLWGRQNSNSNLFCKRYTDITRSITLYTKSIVFQLDRKEEIERGRVEKGKKAGRIGHTYGAEGDRVHANKET